MNYKEFLNYIESNLAEYMTQRERAIEKEQDAKKEEKLEELVYQVELHKVTKNNGIVLDGITIRKEGERISPNIYLNSYFDHYLMGRPITSIMEEVVCIYEDNQADQQLELFDILNFNEVKDRVVIRLVNYEKNKEQLKECPHKLFLDLAITFRYIASKDSCGVASSLISNEEFENWEISIEDLYQVALFNTMREFPWQMDSLAKMVTECFLKKGHEEVTEGLAKELEELEGKECGVNIFVLTNDAGINGATCMLYDNVIKNFAKVQESNIYILPSSIHEVMLVPENEDMDVNFMKNLVREANQSAVGLIDLLSDDVYYYELDSDEFSVCREN